MWQLWLKAALNVAERRTADVHKSDAGSSTTSDKDSCNENNEEEPPPKKIARHRHKGTPQRAPFF